MCRGRVGAETEWGTRRVGENPPATTCRPRTRPRVRAQVRTAETDQTRKSSRQTRQATDPRHILADNQPHDQAGRLLYLLLLM
jgi:hypothetical protein